MAWGILYVGSCYGQLGDHQQALVYYQQAITQFHGIDDHDGLAFAQESLGHLHHQLAHHPDSIACYQRALDRFRYLDDRYSEARTLARLGESFFAAGDINSACDAWQQSLTILDDLDHPDAADIRARLNGLIAP